jgi:hypothetical protein
MNKCPSAFLKKTISFSILIHTALLFCHSFFTAFCASSQLLAVGQPVSHNFFSSFHQIQSIMLLTPSVSDVNFDLLA